MISLPEILTHLKRGRGPVEIVEEGEEAHDKDDVHQPLPGQLPGQTAATAHRYGTSRRKKTTYLTVFQGVSIKVGPKTISPPAPPNTTFLLPSAVNFNSSLILFIVIFASFA